MRMPQLSIAMKRWLKLCFIEEKVNPLAIPPSITLFFWKVSKLIAKSCLSVRTKATGHPSYSDIKISFTFYIISNVTSSISTIWASNLSFKKQIAFSSEMQAAISVSKIFLW